MAHYLLKDKNIIAKIILTLSVFFIVNPCSSMAETERKSEQNEILVIGTGIITGGNVAKAKETAISEALVKGVEEYLARSLGSEGMINNFPRLINDVIPKARDGIEYFHILAEEQTDRHYKILVRLKINEKMMEEKLKETGLILMQGPPIKILFLVSQVESQKREISFWWKDPGDDSDLTPTELILYRVFQERGLSPINRLLNVPEEEYSSEMKILDLSDEDAVRWGRIFLADVVIHGECEIVEENEVSVRLRALDIEKGIIILQDSQTERTDEDGEGMEQTVRTMDKAIAKVAARLSSAIIRAIEVPEASTDHLDITLKGLKNFRQFRDFRDFLKREIAGVKSVMQTKARGNSISIMVEFSGDKAKFLNMLLKHEDFPFNTDLRETEKGEIIINIK